MKKIHLLFLLLLSALLILLPSCEKECAHQSFTESKIAADCIRNGETVYTCDDCGYSFKEDIVEPTGHTFTASTLPPTCTADGYTEYVCKCGFSYKADTVLATGHKYIDTVTPPTCTSEGYTTHNCKNCGYSFVSNHTNTIKHNYTVVVHDSTCTEGGYTVYTCSDCKNEYISEDTSPANHNITFSIIEPTCNTEGYTVHSCSDCEYTFNSDFVAPHGHKITVTVTDPTCTDEGQAAYSCERCEYRYTEVIKPLGHSFSKLITMPTLSDMGYTEYTCQNVGCGYTYTGDFRSYTDLLPGGAYAGNSTPLASGIDVAIYNYGDLESIDFVSIKEAGIDYVIIKAGSSYRENFTLGGIEPTFEQSYADAKTAGLDVGVYFYTYATNVNEIIQDARLLLSILDGKQFEYPIYLDLEDDSLASIDKATITEMCIEFFTILQRAGYYTGLYVNDTWLKEHIDTETALKYFEIWYSRPSSEWDTEKYGEHLGMWQYSFTGTFEAMGDIPFDLNFAYKNYPEIIKNGGFNGYSSDEIKFVDSEKEFVYVTVNSLNVRLTPDFDSDTNIIGTASYGEFFEVLEKANEYTKIKFNGRIAYITANKAYISFEYPLI